jgi:prepilin peptidase CpaA
MERLLSPEFFISLAVLVTATAAVLDLRTGHIPNWLTIGALGVGIGLRLVRGIYQSGFQGLSSAALFVLVAILVCSLVPLLLFRIADMGGGDLKLLAALGALCGPSLGLQAQLYSFIIMFVYALGRLAYEGKLWQTIYNTLLLIPNLIRRKRPLAVDAVLVQRMRFAPAVLVGLLAAALGNWAFYTS